LRDEEVYDDVMEFDDDLSEEEYAAVERKHDFVNVGTTNEYTEKFYYNKQPSSIFTNKFYLDFVEFLFTNDNIGNQNFLSQNFIYSSSSITEIIFVLSLLDLPFEKTKLETSQSDKDLKINTNGNLMVFCKEVVELEANVKEESDLLISQNFFDALNKYKSDSSVIKKVIQFEKGKLYGSRVAITNTSDSEIQINVLTEIPQGSIPIAKLDYFYSTTLYLNPLKTEIIEFYFYFPKQGDFTVYPASITKDIDLIATANVQSNLTVLNKITLATNSESIIDALATGSKKDILNFIRTTNLCISSFSIADIYFLLKDKKFYEDLL